MIRFFVKGKPVPQARPRTFKPKGAKRYVTTNPRRSETWKETVCYEALKFKPRDPFEGPIRLDFEFHFKLSRNRKGGLWADVRPDIDNLVKGPMDALQKVGFYKDDSQIVWIECKKYFSFNEKPGLSITVMPLKEDPC